MRLSEVRLLRREAVHLSQGGCSCPGRRAALVPYVLFQEAQEPLRAELKAREGLGTRPRVEHDPGDALVLFLND